MFLKTIRPPLENTCVVSPTTSRCRSCKAPIDSSCSGQGLCTYCYFTTVKKQRTCCFCWSPMSPSSPALPGAPAAASESPASPSPAVASLVPPPADSPVDFVSENLIPAITQHWSSISLSRDLLELQLQAIFPAQGAHSVEEVEETALDLWNISLAQKAEQHLSLKEYALNCRVFITPVKTASADLRGTKSVLVNPVRTCPAYSGERRGGGGGEGGN